jgi:hypothetical protein
MLDVGIDGSWALGTGALPWMVKSGTSALRESLTKIVPGLIAREEAPAEADCFS